MFTIRELEEFIKTLPEEIKDSPVLIETDDVEQYEVSDINHTWGKVNGHKLVLEFSYDHKTE